MAWSDESVSLHEVMFKCEMFVTFQGKTWHQDAKYGKKASRQRQAGPGIRVDVTSVHTTYLNTTTDKVHHLNGHHLILQDNAVPE